MTSRSSLNSWLTISVDGAPNKRYQHHLLKEVTQHRATLIKHMQAVAARAHDDARRHMQRLAVGSLDPLGASARLRDPAEGYPSRLHLQTLKGYFGELFAGVAATDLGALNHQDWEVPAHLFRFHLVEFQQLDAIAQTGADAAKRPGRTGDDCLAFRRSRDGKIVSTLFCEAKCTADHDSGLINEAHEKSSSALLLPVDLLQIIAVLEDSPDGEAKRWIAALRQLYHSAPPDQAEYERCDHVTYVCGQFPRQKRHWIPPKQPHDKYTGGRRLHVAELHVSNVDELVAAVYGKV